MSEQPAAVELPPTGDAAFAALMDVLVPDAPGEASGTGDPALDGAGGEGGGTAGAGDLLGEGGVPTPLDLGTDTGAPAIPTAGDDPGVAGPADAGGEGGAGEPADAGPPAGDRAPAGTLDVTTISKDLAGLSQAFETTTRQAFQQQALEEVRTEHAQYFEALRKHPRLLVGVQVPSLTSDDPEAMETLRDAADARDWQEAVKTILTEEVRSRAEKAVEENSSIINTVHASIEIFTKNKDLVPGTKQFNRQLADRFAAMAKPYELRVDGKLHGYTIPVQPLIDQLRTQLAATPKPASPGAPAAPATPKPPPPQRGIRSKAGASTETEDFTTLFGTLGLPDLSR